MSKYHSTTRNSDSYHFSGDKDGLIYLAFAFLFELIGLYVAFIKSPFGWILFSFGILVTIVAVSIIGRNCVVNVNNDYLDINIYLFSHLKNNYKITIDSFKNFSIYKSSMSTGQGGKFKEKYGIRLFTQKGKMITLGGRFDSLKEAAGTVKQLQANFKT